jgi:hypothetical protein
MASIYDENFWESGVEFDISDALEKEQAKYEEENKDHITVEIIKEPELPPMTKEEQADSEISRARVAFVLGYGTQKEWEDTIRKWGREVPKY